MKRKITTIIVLLIITLLTESIIAQTNSVRLNGSTFFNSITAAYNSLGGTISSPHIIEMLASYTGANEVFPITLTQKTGSSILNTITIRPASGVTDVIVNPYTNENFDGGIIGTGPFPSISLDGADYTIIDGRAGGTGSVIVLMIKNTSTNLNSGIIELKNGANNNVIKYVNCYEPGAFNQSTGGRNIIISTSNAIKGGNNNNTIDHCIINGGRRGVQTFGTAGNDTGCTNNNTIITNNIVKNQTGISIFLGSEAIGNTVTGNEIFMDTVVATTMYRAIKVQSVGINDITSNRIHSITSVIGSSSLVGIELTPVALTAPGSNSCTINVINNMVSIFDAYNSSATIICMNIFQPIIGSTPHVANVLNNSMLAGGFASNSITSTSSALTVAQPGSLSTYNGFNNLAINHRTGGNASTKHIGMNLPGGFINRGQSDYNTCWATDTVKGAPVQVFGVIYKTVVAVMDTASINCQTSHCTLNSDSCCVTSSCCESGIDMNIEIRDVAYMSETDLRLIPARVGGGMNCIPLAAVTADFEGNPRNTNYPYRGAYEGPPLKVLSVRALFQGITVTSGTLVGPYELRNISPPYQIKSTCRGELDNQSKAYLCFGDSIPLGSEFYIVVKQRNHLETWSGLTTHFSSGTGDYIFDAALHYAYGNNMYGTAPPYQIFGGDVNQNGSINLTDVILINNDAVLFRTGFNLNTDINNDEIVDLTDLMITYNNSVNFVSVMKP